jgi:hypothetical protein
MPDALSLRVGGAIMAEVVDHQVTGLAGEFLTAGKLLKRGYQVSLTFGNAKAIDLFVHNPRTNRTFRVQVKTQRRKNGFPLKRESIAQDDIYVFVRLNAVACDEQFFILPGSIMIGNINHFYGSSYRSERPSSMPCVNYGPLTCYEDNWDVFDQPEQSAP